MCGNRHKYSAAAPVFGNQFIFGKFLLYLIHIGAGFINLVDGNNDLNAGRLCMVDGLNGLRHPAVICGNYQDGNIR